MLRKTTLRDSPFVSFVAAHYLGAIIVHVVKHSLIVDMTSSFIEFLIVYAILILKRLSTQERNKHVF